MVWFCTDSCMCILRGRLSSTTKGPLTSPKEIVPEIRSERTARSLSRPPRAVTTLARISSAVCAETATGSRDSSAMQRFLSLIEFMVAAGRDKREVGSESSGRVNARSDHPHPRCFAKRVRKPLKIKEANAKKSAKREQEAASGCKQKS